MSRKVFLDTNVLLYAVDKSDVERQDIALSLLNVLHDEDVSISTQVLQEFFDVAIRKMGLNDTEAEPFLIDFEQRFDVVQVTPHLIHKAIRLRENVSVSFYDSIMLATAISCDCAMLFTEDLNDGQMVETIRISNPSPQKPKFVKKK